ncbi:hypothetical protein [Streptomyces capparidis]
MALAELRSALADAGVLLPGLRTGPVVLRSSATQVVDLGRVLPATARELASVIRVGAAVLKWQRAAGPDSGTGPAPAVGTIVRDTSHPADSDARPVIGRVMARMDGRVWLRPLGGGREWTADPCTLIPGLAEALRPAVREANRTSVRGRGAL